jgi:hypothetical protein
MRTLMQDTTVLGHSQVGVVLIEIYPLLGVWNSQMYRISAAVFGVSWLLAWL